MNSSGAAPVPPSLSSTTMKSGVIPESSIALHSAITSQGWPTHSLNPAGLPPESSRIRAMNCISSTRVAKAECAAGGYTVFAHRHPPDRRDLCRDLGRRQNPAVAGFCTLAQLQPHHLDLGVRHSFGELIGVAAAVGPAAAETARSDFPNQIAPSLVVTGGNTALAGVMGITAALCPPVQRAHRIGRQGTIAHRGYVQDRCRIGLCAGAAVPDDHAVGAGLTGRGAMEWCSHSSRSP